MPLPLPVVSNLAEATFECIFGRGCDGLCCKNGRPSLDKGEQARIKKVLKRVLPLLRPKARELIEEEGFMSKRIKIGLPMMRVVDGWCVFFNKGCTLHQLGAQDGDSYQYKPSQCALFPIEQDVDNSWFIRQWGHKQEDWNLFCLSPNATKKRAAETLEAELEYLAKMEANA
jgi:Fe-S-cluster containining protein